MSSPEVAAVRLIRASSAGPVPRSSRASGAKFGDQALQPADRQLDLLDRPVDGLRQSGADDRTGALLRAGPSALRAPEASRRGARMPSAFAPARTPPRCSAAGGRARLTARWRWRWRRWRRTRTGRYSSSGSNAGPPLRRSKATSSPWVPGDGSGSGATSAEVAPSTRSANPWPMRLERIRDALGRPFTERGTGNRPGARERACPPRGPRVRQRPPPPPAPPRPSRAPRRARRDPRRARPRFTTSSSTRSRSVFRAPTGLSDRRRRLEPAHGSLELRVPALLARCRAVRC